MQMAAVRGAAADRSGINRKTVESAPVCPGRIHLRDQVHHIVKVVGREVGHATGESRTGERLPKPISAVDDLVEALRSKHIFNLLGCQNALGPRE